MHILLYAPELTGHPQVYCRVIGDILLEHGHKVLIASGTDSRTWATIWPDLRIYSNNQNVELIDTRTFSKNGHAHLTAEEMVHIQRERLVDSTLFVEADLFKDEFTRIAEKNAPPLVGKNSAIFANTCLWFPGEDPYSGKPHSLIEPTMRANLGKLKRRIIHHKESNKYFFEKTLINKCPVDKIIVKDERVVNKYGPPVYWMPEIYRVFEPEVDNTRFDDWNLFANKIKKYVLNSGRENILLYFGTGAWYKGYDYFLRLADMDPSTFALHTGAPNRHEHGKMMDFDTEEIRCQLLQQGRLFETRCFVESYDLVRLAFDSIERFVSTHRLTLSSGTMLQSLDYGKPVLTPDSGLVGYRTRTYGLGMTYRYLDADDMADKWREFRQMKATDYSKPISEFMNKFSREEVSRAFTNFLLD